MRGSSETPKKHFGPTVSEPSTALHIAFGVDTEFIPPMGIAVTSIVENNPDLALAIHVVGETLDPNNARRLEILAQRYDLDITFYYRDLASDRLASLAAPRGISRAIYYRLVICDLLADITSRVLYLDADVVCIGNISELAWLDFKGATLAAVLDYDQATRLANCGLSDEARYFNSGFLYIDIARWNANRIGEKTVDEIVKLVRRSLLPDQDALNIVLLGQVCFVDRKWNLLHGIYPTMPNSIFLHYAGFYKPWHDWAPNFQQEFFAKYQALSPWADWQFVPKSRKHRKRFARHLLQQRRLGGALLWFLLYAFTG